MAESGGGVALAPVRSAGEFFAFALDVFVAMFKWPFAWREFLEQTWFVARVSMLPAMFLAIPFTVVSVFLFNGLLVEFGAADLSGTGASVTTVNEIGPFVTVLVVSGSGAAAICADLGDMYCRVPQDSSLDVRGARNLPCLTRPRKRAPTVKICESDEQYIPLNAGYNWKGDPNATLSGQPVPQMPRVLRHQAALRLPRSRPPPIAAAHYDPATGTYTGPDGRQYTQSDLSTNGKPKTWQDLLTPSAP
jgi:Permease MlaE